MLSHVYALKDIMSAIKAAAIIVHDYGVKDYALESAWLGGVGLGYTGWGWGTGVGVAVALGLGLGWG